jgi:hypothetical protein
MCNDPGAVWRDPKRKRGCSCALLPRRLGTVIATASIQCKRAESADREGSNDDETKHRRTYRVEDAYLFSAVWRESTPDKWCLKS